MEPWRSLGCMWRFLKWGFLWVSGSEHIAIELSIWSGCNTKSALSNVWNMSKKICSSSPTAININIWVYSPLNSQIGESVRNPHCGSFWRWPQSNSLYHASCGILYKLGSESTFFPKATKCKSDTRITRMIGDVRFKPRQVVWLALSWVKMFEFKFALQCWCPKKWRCL